MLCNKRISEVQNQKMYYDLKVGGGAEAVKGSRVAVHYVAKWKGITFMTSRQGMGVSGGTPYGFDVGQSERGNVLKGLDFGVKGMRVGGQRLLIVPPQLAYGSKGVQEIPPNATIELDVELLAIKQSPFGCVTWVSCQNRRRITQSYSLPYCHLVHQKQKQTTFSKLFYFDSGLRDSEETSKLSSKENHEELLPIVNYSISSVQTIALSEPNLTRLSEPPPDVLIFDRRIEAKAPHLLHPPQHLSGDTGTF
ncbi:hypothetical protein RHGRI_007125 [Rhododendron griersonianum]|uniref:peptidylprolyl isomerase n=1 Tax=Rhododendron griersonianum TaxID=479676 RepID=A0AAV6KYP1_9ERIC|nr:hypothetical protein RHGRI_007125 [Rhododendron griersonianum]